MYVSSRFGLNSEGAFEERQEGQIRACWDKLKGLTPNVSVKPHVMTVKQERPDEAEIEELAAKMKEANKLKMAGVNAPGAVQQVRPMAGTGGQTSITSFTNRAIAPKPPVTLPDDKKAIDEDSQKGRFGWVTMGTKLTPIPFIIRHSERYCAVRMVEVKLLNKFLSFLHSEIYSYTNIRSYYITDAEARVLNEINLKHCDSQFGRDHFIPNKDVVVRLQDASEFHNFLEVCYNKLNYQSNAETERCGFIRINNESVVPYTVKSGVKCVPLFYFEGETDSLKLKAMTLEGWDLAYLKFCCKVQGIRNELFASETCSVISLSDIQSYFPAGTVFDEYWPTKIGDSQLLAKNPVTNASWTRQPAGAPNTPSVGAKPAGPHQRAFPPAHTPPVAGTPGPQPNLPSVLSGWANGNLMHQQQQAGMSSQQASSMAARLAQAQAQQSLSQMANANNATYNAALRWPVHQPTAGGSFFYPQVPMTMAQKTYPPPLIRNSHASNSPLTSIASGQVPMNDPVRTYSAMAKTQAARAGIATTAHKYPGFGGPDVMDLSSQQQQMLQYSSANGRTNVMVPKEKKLIQIEDVATTGSHTPYQVQKALVGSKMVPSINMHPYRYNELLMTLPDLITHFFPNTSMISLLKALQDALSIPLYRANRQQTAILKMSGKCRADKDVPPLIQVHDVMNFMPQLKYILSNQKVMPTTESSAAKRQRIS